MKSIFYSFYILVILLKSCMSNDWKDADYVKREHSLIKPYQGAGMTIPNWDFYGSTMVTNSFIRLTSDQQSRQGAIFNNIPVRFPNWEVHMQFKAYGHGKDLYGDGFAFWYVKEIHKPGDIFGYSDFFCGLGIFLDTYANQNGAHNHGHPYISAMVNNGSLHYDHDRDGTHTELAGCEAKFRSVDHETQIAIRYENDVLSVYTDIEGKNTWKECFTVKGITLPTGYYLGISASTGELSDNHDIISIKTYELENLEKDANSIDRSNILPSAAKSAAPREHVDDPTPSMSNFKLFMLILCAIIAVIILVVVSVLFFQKQQQTSRKRFY